jgi:hypothetical protein
MGGRLKITSETIRAKAYLLMREAVEVGAAYGWQRAHKHVEHPTPEAIQDAITDAVMNEIAERFSFSDDYE